MGTSKIQKNCHWYVDKNGKMLATCIDCVKKDQKGWFWEGSELGFGDYDLQCSTCGEHIHLRDYEKK